MMYRIRYHAARMFVRHVLLPLGCDELADLLHRRVDPGYDAICRALENGDDVVMLP